MSDGITTDVYDEDYNQLAESAVCRVIKVGIDRYTLDIVGNVNAEGDSSDGTDNLNSLDNYYILRAESTTLSSTENRYNIKNIPILWTLNSEDDLYIIVFSVEENMRTIEGLNSNYMELNVEAGTLSILAPFGECDYIAYIYRREAPQNEFSITGDGQATTSSILAQFLKDNRVLKQIVAEEKRYLRTPDEMTILPEGTYRAGKILAFDDDGNPICSTSLEDILEIQEQVNSTKAEILEILEEMKALSQNTEIK